jgi:myo-inositol-hexaphosphate 3-phosphohydrolase
MALVVLTGTVMAVEAQTVLQPVVRTAALFNYEDAPAAPDADDPAIWINRRNHTQSLIIGTAKDDELDGSAQFLFLDFRDALRAIVD